jgi:hypothetical protein
MGKYNRAIIGGIIGLALLALLTAPPAALAEPVEVVPLWGPYLTAISETGITVNWKTEGDTDGAVEYAPEESYLESGAYGEPVPDASKELHHVVLAGLQPGTTYHYRVRIGENYTADHTFATLGPGAFTFIVYGDTREQAPLYTQLDRHKLVAERIAREKNISFILHTGDLVCDGSDLAEWGRFFEAARQMLEDIPIFPVAGNHENDSRNYYDIFGMPPYYSFGCSNAWFSMLDSNDGADLAGEAAWLAGNVPPTARWKFATCHHPLYTSDPNHWGGDTSLQEAWEPAFIAAGINAVFSAHVHVYERYWENGIHYVVLGTGGAPSYELAEKKIDGYRSSLEHTLGYARVTVDGEQAVMEVIEVAELSSDNAEVVNIFPQDTVFETVSLLPEAPEKPLPGSVEISVSPDEISYGKITPGQTSPERLVTINNTGTESVNVTLEIQGEPAALDFYNRSLYIDDAIYSPELIICVIPAGGSKAVATRLRVPRDWINPGVMQVTFLFWAQKS